MPPDIADMKVQGLCARGDEKECYFFLLKPTTRSTLGWCTLFVPPGGWGDA